MGKRTADGAGLTNINVVKRKKPRQNRKNQATAEVRAEGPSGDTDDGNTLAQVPEVSLRGKERLREEAAHQRKMGKRAAKKGKKHAEERKLDPLKPPTAEEEVAVRVVREAARRQKRAEKAARKSAEYIQEDGTVEETTTSISSGRSSNATPNEASSATSPEPDGFHQEYAELEKLIAEPKTIPKISKYTSHPELSRLSEEDVEKYLKKSAITIAEPGQSKSTLRPILAFKYLPIDPDQLSIFSGFISPTPIQAAAWPYLLCGRDVIGIAETGSGKTLAFGIPCIQHILKSRGKPKSSIEAVVVSPTRELAIQIYEQLQKLTDSLELKVVCVYGGVSKDDQKKRMKGAKIVVATPGRLNDLINDGAINIRNAGYVVLDEADRMLDKGFEEDVRKIISSTAPQSRRQTLMFTATWPESVRKLASTFMKDAVKINIGDATGELRANTRIEQVVEVIDPITKQKRLLELLRNRQHNSTNAEPHRILVFCLYKKEADRTHSFLRSNGIKCVAIHGDMTQPQRLTSLELFKKAEIPCLIATDVAARGLDIPDVKLVINATFPLTAEDYVHRIGRTGRAGAAGKAITLFTAHDKPLAGSLINVLRAANQPVPDELLAFGTTVKKKAHEHYGAFYKDTGNMKAATKIKFDD